MREIYLKIASEMTKTYFNDQHHKATKGNDTKDVKDVKITALSKLPFSIAMFHSFVQKFRNTSPQNFKLITDIIWPEFEKISDEDNFIKQFNKLSLTIDVTENAELKILCEVFFSIHFHLWLKLSPSCRAAIPIIPLNNEGFPKREPTQVINLTKSEEKKAEISPQMPAVLTKIATSMETSDHQAQALMVSFSGLKKPLSLLFDPLKYTPQLFQKMLMPHCDDFKNYPAQDLIKDDLLNIYRVIKFIFSTQDLSNFTEHPCFLLSTALNALKILLLQEIFIRRLMPYEITALFKLINSAEENLHELLKLIPEFKADQLVALEWMPALNTEMENHIKSYDLKQINSNSQKDLSSTKFSANTKQLKRLLWNTFCFDKLIVKALLISAELSLANSNHRPIHSIFKYYLNILLKALESNEARPVILKCCSPNLKKTLFDALNKDGRLSSLFLIDFASATSDSKELIAYADFLRNQILTSRFIIQLWIRGDFSKFFASLYKIMQNPSEYIASILDRFIVRNITDSGVPNRCQIYLAFFDVFGNTCSSEVINKFLTNLMRTATRDYQPLRETDLIQKICNLSNFKPNLALLEEFLKNFVNNPISMDDTIVSIMITMLRTIPSNDDLKNLLRVLIKNMLNQIFSFDSCSAAPLLAPSLFNECCKQLGLEEAAFTLQTYRTDPRLKPSLKQSVVQFFRGSNQEKHYDNEFFSERLDKVARNLIADCLTDKLIPEVLSEVLIETRLLSSPLIAIVLGYLAQSRENLNTKLLSQHASSTTSLSLNNF